MKIDIIYEDQDLAVINKPTGVVVNQAATVTQPTIQSWFKERLIGAKVNQLDTADWQQLVPSDFNDEYGSPEEIFEQRQGLVHRLDKDTSGALVLAKNPGALVNLLAQFKNHQVYKEYQCLAHGKFRVPTGSIRAPVGRADFDRQRFTVKAAGRPAVTHYQVNKFYPTLNWQQVDRLFTDQQLPQTKLSLAEFKRRASIYQGFSLVSCQLETGRTHQIRVHFKHWHHPLVGDDKYVGKKRAKLDKIWCPRQFLHASRLKLIHPRTQQQLEFQADLAVDLRSVSNLLLDPSKTAHL